MIGLLLLASTVGAYRVDETSDLNRALSTIINEMKTDGFYASSFVRNIGGTPTTFPTGYVCSASLPAMHLIEADSDLARVLISGVLRVGYAEASVAGPYIVESPQLAGSEIDAAREAGRRLGLAYDRAVRVEFVFIPASLGPFFDAIVSQLNERKVDVVWSRIGIAADRALAVDFTCASFPSQLVLYAGPDVPTTLPGTFTVGCVGSIFCSQKLPAGGTFSGTKYDSVSALIAAVAHGTEKYAIGNLEQIVYLSTTDECLGCSIVSATFDKVLLAPMTRRLERPTQAALIGSVAAQHATQIRALVPFANKHVAAAAYGEAKAASQRYAGLCANTQRAKQCSAAVDDSFEALLAKFERGLSDSPDASSSELD